MLTVLFNQLKGGDQCLIVSNRGRKS